MRQHKTFKLLKSCGLIPLAELTDAQLLALAYLKPDQYDWAVRLRKNPTVAIESVWLANARGINMLMNEHSGSQRSCGGDNIPVMADSIKNGKWVPVSGAFIFNHDSKLIDGQHRGAAISRCDEWVVIIVLIDISIEELHTQVNEKITTAPQFVQRCLPSSELMAIGGFSKLTHLGSVINLAVRPSTPRKVAKVKGGWRQRNMFDVLFPYAKDLVNGFPAKANIFTRNATMMPFVMARAAGVCQLGDLQRAVDVFAHAGTPVPGFEMFGRIRDLCEAKALELGGITSPRFYLWQFVNLMTALAALGTGEGHRVELLHEDMDGTVPTFRAMKMPFWWPAAVLAAVPEFATTHA